MAALHVLAALALAVGAAGLQVETSHNLTICNAYADSRGLSVYTTVNKAKLMEEPLEYKACKELTLEIAQDEKIDFKLGGLSVGTFHATGLSQFAGQPSLLLVPHRKDNATMSAGFMSHMYMRGGQAQVAIVDAYIGAATGTMKIAPISASSKKRVEEATLIPKTVLSLATGAYEVILKDASAKDIKVAKLNAAENDKQVVLRVGNDERGQELIVFNERASGAQSGSSRACFGFLAAAAALATMLA